MRWILRGALVLLLTSCADQGDLSERHARATAEALISTNGPRIRDFHQVKWKSLKQVSPTEAHGTAVMVFRFPLPNGDTGEEHIPGRFVYHKKPGEGWTLDYVDFPNPNSLYHRLDQKVFVKVTSAKVAPSLVEGQIPGPADTSGSEDDPYRQVAAAQQESTDTRGAASGSGATPSSASARRAAERYLTTMPPGAGTWTAKNFQLVRQVSANEIELPAMLVIESTEDTLEYHGGFYFTYEPIGEKWMLRRLSFRSQGLEPIEEAVGSLVAAE